ncbi:hypothetical protein ACIPIU_28750 [Streptomyces massasporeus]|uniref:hypothetical protein n=1 Tax=Streptomyces massasporeus TaxID=67324 RepID=UPI003801294F
MGRPEQVDEGTTRGCLLNGCLAVLVLLCVGVIALWVWGLTADDRAVAKARADLRGAAEAGQASLVRAASDGVVDDGEIARVFPRGKPAQGLVGIERQGPDVTVTAELLGRGPGFFLAQTEVTGCFTFEVTPDAHRTPVVTVRELAVEDEPRSACTAAGVPSPAALPSASERGNEGPLSTR